MSENTTVQMKLGGKPQPLAAGALVDDWLVVRALSHGGFGTVYEVRHRVDHTPAALKLLHAHLARSPEMLARFDREIRVVRGLHHPNIVELVAAGFSATGQPYLCMELLDGENLASLLRRRGPMAPELAVETLAPLCDGLATAHDRGIVHRDIKASNVMVCRAPPEQLGRVVLLDFGISKLSDALAPELTQSNEQLGTPACMAPEQIVGGRVDARTDVYGLGVLFFKMLTGRLPFQHASPKTTQLLHLHARRPPASAHAPVPALLDDVLACAMAIDPDERFATPRALIAAARAAIRDRDTAVQPSVTEVAAVLVAVRDRDAGASLDEALLEDLEAVLPAAERILVDQGFRLVLDLGASCIFAGGQDPVAIALRLWTELAQRARRDPRVAVGVCAHRGSIAEIDRLATWQLPDSFEGVWITHALDARAPGGKRVC